MNDKEMSNAVIALLVDSLQKRVNQIEEKEAIVSLMNDYCRVCDTHDFKAFGNKFTEDGVLNFEEWGEIKGPSAITEATRVEGNVQGLQHSITNLNTRYTVNACGQMANQKRREVSDVLMILRGSI